MGKKRFHKRLSDLHVFSNIKLQPTMFKISSNIGWLFFDKGLKILIGLIVGAWITRYLGPARFGVLRYATAYVALFTPLSGLGLANIVIRDIVKKPTEKDTILGTSFLLKSVASFFSYGLSILIIYLYKPFDTQLLKLITILSGVLIFEAWSSTFDSWFQSQVKAKYSVWSKNISIVILGLVRIGLILYQAPLVAFVWATLLEVGLICSFMVFFYYSSKEKISIWNFNLLESKRLLKDSWPLIVSATAVIIYTKIDHLILGNLKTDEVVGVYSAAVQISELWYVIPMAISYSLLPAIINSHGKSTTQEYNDRMQIYFDLMASIAYAIIFIVVIFAPLLVKILYGSEYYQAGLILRVHILTFIFVSLQFAGHSWMLVENLTKYYMISSIMGAVVNVALNYLLIPRYAGMGAAWASVISYAVAAFFLTLLSSDMKILFSMLFSSLLMPFRVVSIWKSFQKFLFEDS